MGIITTHSVASRARRRAARSPLRLDAFRIRSNCDASSIACSPPLPFPIFALSPPGLSRKQTSSWSRDEAARYLNDPTRTAEQARRVVTALALTTTEATKPLIAMDTTGLIQPPTVKDTEEPTEAAAMAEILNYAGSDSGGDGTTTVTTNGTTTVTTNETTTVTANETTTATSTTLAQHPNPPKSAPEILSTSSSTLDPSRTKPSLSPESIMARAILPLLPAAGKKALPSVGSPFSSGTRGEVLMAEKEAAAGVDAFPHSPYSDDGVSAPGPSGSYPGEGAAAADSSPAAPPHSRLHEPPQSFTPYSDRPSTATPAAAAAPAAAGTPSIRAPSLAPTDDARTSASSPIPGQATHRALTSQYAHLVEEGMTEEEIRRLEEEERQLDADIERAARR
ncbi:hypothetical protein VTH06DRAFT_2582 [Thermothelomyces fergusii]